jgi:hypothetical protein
VNGHADMVTPENRVAAFLLANVGLPFCMPCLALELRLAAQAVVSAVSMLAGCDRFKLTNRLCARCFREHAVIYLGMK